MEYMRCKYDELASIFEVATLGGGVRIFSTRSCMDFHIEAESCATTARVQSKVLQTHTGNRIQNNIHK